MSSACTCDMQHRPSGKDSTELFVLRLYFDLIVSDSFASGCCEGVRILQLLSLRFMHFSGQRSQAHTTRSGVFTPCFTLWVISLSFDLFSGLRRLILTLLFYFTGFVIRFPNPSSVHRVLPASGRSVAKGLYFNISLGDQYRALIQQPNPSVQWINVQVGDSWSNSFFWEILNHFMLTLHKNHCSVLFTILDM